MEQSVRRNLELHRKLRLCANADFLLSVIFDPEDGGGYVPPKHRRTFNAVHSILSQKQNSSLDVQSYVRAQNSGRF